VGLESFISKMLKAIGRLQRFTLQPSALLDGINASSKL
jgi:hypothetical protein